MRPFHRSCPFVACLLLVSVAGSVCAQGGACPPVDLGAQVRVASWAFVVASRDDPIGVFDPTGRQYGGIVDEVHDFGPLGLHPEGRGPNALGHVYANETGMTYWAFVESPRGAFGADAVVAHEAHFMQEQAFRKTCDGATLSYAVSAMTLEALDFGGPFDCPTSDSLFIDRDHSAVYCWTVEAAIDFELWGYWGFGDDAQWFYYNRWRVRLFGVRDQWIYWAWREPWDWGEDRFVPSFAPLHGEEDFEFTSAGSRASLKLRRPLHLDVPLEIVPLFENVSMYTRVTVRAANHGSEAYASAFFRDPAEGGGTALEFDGMEPVEPFLEFPTRESRPGAPLPCDAGAPAASAGRIEFERDAYHGGEVAGGLARVTLLRSGGTDGRVSVRVTTNGGSAAAASDYEPVDVRVIFEDGESGPLTVTVPILADAEEEDDETVGIVLSEPGGCAVLGDRTAATVSIIDDDRPPRTYRLGGTVTGLEGRSLVLRNGPTVADLVVGESGPFLFEEALPVGARYDVRVESQPIEPRQICTVERGSGQIPDGDVVDIVVACETPLELAPLDPRFGTGGRATLRGVTVDAIALDGAGRILVAGGDSRSVARLDENGALDPSFGAGGIERIPFGGVRDDVRGIAWLADGRVIITGSTSDALDEVPYFATARLLEDGSLDSTFGASGIARTVFPLGGRAFDLAIQPDGKIVVAGHGKVDDDFRGRGQDYAVARYSPDGDPDPAFGSGGVVTVEVVGRGDFGAALALAPDGKIVVAGRAGVDNGGTDPDFGIVRLEADGTLDVGFGHEGRFVFDTEDVWDQATDVVVEPDGGVVAVGFFSVRWTGPLRRYHHRVVRLRPDGALDREFGVDGWVTIAYSTESDFGRSVALAPDGKILVVGDAAELGNGDMAVARLLSDGRLDETFGIAGRVTIDFFGEFDEAVDAVTMEDGGILLAGRAYEQRREGLALARLSPVETETPPPTFQRGDANTDGALDIADALAVLSHLFLGGAELGCPSSADVDDDGSLTITDAIRVLGYLFLGAGQPPAPFGGCGADPTPDTLDCSIFDPCP